MYVQLACMYVSLYSSTCNPRGRADVNLFDLFFSLFPSNFTARTRNVVKSSGKPAAAQIESGEAQGGFAICSTHASLVKPESGGSES